MKRKRAGFTLIETVFSVFILLLICQLAVCSLKAGLTMTNKMTKLKEDPGIPAIQLEEFLKQADLQTEHSNSKKLSVKHHNGKTYNLNKKYGSGGFNLVFGNESGLGYMPLFYQIRTVEFAYQQPLLTCTLETMNHEQNTYGFLINPVSEKDKTDVSKQQKHKKTAPNDQQPAY